ncbi:MAG: HD-GYP domain-containing protein [Bacteroidales bacterium]
MSELQPIVDAFLQSFEVRRPFVVSHARRVSTYAVRLATQYGLGADVIENIRVGALLHDAGKILIPSRILTKPGRLNQYEWVELRTHPDKGLELLERVGLNAEMRDIVLHHHERFDGRGYPDGLSGVQIPWSVRIVSVMDSFDALTSTREYRERLTPGAARALIAREAGTRFCPWVVAGFLSLPLALLEPGPEAPCPDSYLPEGRPEASSMHATQVWTVSPN